MMCRNKLICGALAVFAMLVTTGANAALVPAAPINADWRLADRIRAALAALDRISTNVDAIVERAKQNADAVSALRAEWAAGGPTAPILARLAELSTQVETDQARIDELGAEALAIRSKLTAIAGSYQLSAELTALLTKAFALLRDVELRTDLTYETLKTLAEDITKLQVLITEKR